MEKVSFFLSNPSSDIRIWRHTSGLAICVRKNYFLSKIETEEEYNVT